MAIIEFSGSSENDLTVVSGSFVLSEPDYPKPTAPAEPDYFVQDDDNGYQGDIYNNNYAEDYILQ